MPFSPSRVNDPRIRYLPIDSPRIPPRRAGPMSIATRSTLDASAARVRPSRLLSARPLGRDHDRDGAVWPAWQDAKWTCHRSRPLSAFQAMRIREAARLANRLRVARAECDVSQDELA